MKSRYDPHSHSNNHERIRGCARKVRFPDELHAIHAAIGHSCKHGPCRYYHCPFCGGYHLTHKLRGIRNKENGTSRSN